MATKHQLKNSRLGLVIFNERSRVKVILFLQWDFGVQVACLKYPDPSVHMPVYRH